MNKKRIKIIVAFFISVVCLLIIFSFIKYKAIYLPFGWREYMPTLNQGVVSQVIEENNLQKNYGGFPFLSSVNYNLPKKLVPDGKISPTGLEVCAIQSLPRNEEESVWIILTCGGDRNGFAEKLNENITVISLAIALTSITVSVIVYYKRKKQNSNE